MRIAVVVTGLFGLAACHPLACFHPADLPKDPPLVLRSSAAFPKEKVEVLVDDLGIPHIFGNDEVDLAYGLGVMQGRDRAFQILTFKHAGEGRVAELLGADYLDVDRELRILTYRTDEILEAVTGKDKDIVDAFCAGVNEGARMAGDSAEMAILGVHFGELTPKDVLAIVRLQQWGQTVGFSEELNRFLWERRVTSREGTAAPAIAALIQDSPSGGVPIVTEEENEAAPFDPTARRTPRARDEEKRRAEVSSSSSSEQAPRAQTKRSAKDMVRASMMDSLRDLLRPSGASNSWSVSPEHTDSGAAVLANDPHLSHSAPGIFYMVHMEGPDFTVAGGSFPGIPAVLIGHGRNIAWGITNGYVDNVDLVRLKPFGDRDDLYEVDGEPVEYGRLEQSFKLGTGDDAEVVKETWRTSQFGLVLPPTYGRSDGKAYFLPTDHIAMLWTAAEYPSESGNFVTAFWQLAKSKNADEATTALQHFPAPVMNINMAFTDGTIAWRLNGIVPIRNDEQRVDRMRDGSVGTAGWGPPLPADQKPHTTSPSKGYIVATNQRVVENGVGAQAFVGFEAAQPWRAMRVDERIKALIDGGGKPTTDELLSIQQDAVSLQSKELAPILGKHCPSKTHARMDNDNNATDVRVHDEAQVKAFCDAIAGFDGNYTVDSLGALPYARTWTELLRAVYWAHTHDAQLSADLIGETWAVMAVHEAVKAADAGEPSALFFDPDGGNGLDAFVARAVQRALDLVEDETGASPQDWRWGRLHTLSLRGRLSAAPVIGFLFQTDAREETGTSTSPRAEGPDLNNKMRVAHGAGLRLIAEMTDPPTVRMVNDSGQSGHFGHRHLEDQYPLWHSGSPRKLVMTKAEVKKVIDGALTIEPK